MRLPKWIGISWEMLNGGVLEGLQGVHRTFGEVVDVQIGATRFYFVSSPAGIEHVLVNNRANYRKSSVTKKAKPLFGNGLFTNDGESWQTQRRLMAPAFHRRQIGGLALMMSETITEMLTRWERDFVTNLDDGTMPDDSIAKGRRDEFDGEPPHTSAQTLRNAAIPSSPTNQFNLSAELHQLTMHIAARGLFGSSISAETAQTVSDAITYLQSLFQTRALLPFEWINRLPLPSNRKMQTTLDTLNAIIFDIIAERRKQSEWGDDLLGLLMAAQDEDTGIGMSDEQLRDEAMTLFVAGHETTANHLTWTLWLLDQNPGWRDKLVAEVGDLFGDRVPTMADVGQLKIVRQVIDESLRLFPVGWIFGRRSIAADKLLGYDVKPGTTIVMSPYVVHRRPDLWENPDQFNPARFATSQSRPRFVYWPFGGGQRRCIGEQFALLESTLALAMIHQRCRVKIVSNDVEPWPSVTLRPKNPLIATLGR